MLINRFKVISKFVSIQLLVQALSWISGILLIRALDQTQYAYFTVANTMQSTMSLLADMGIGISLSSIGGRVWQDRYRFGQLINTAMQLRHHLTIVAVSIITPILIWMLIGNGASIANTALITIVVLVGLSFRVTADVLIVVPRLHSEINRIQNLDLLSATSRLIFLGIAYLTFLNAAVAIAGTSMVAGIQRFILSYWATENIDPDALVSQEDRKFIVKTIRSVAPNGLFFCIQGQMTIFLISIFGNTQNIAEIGALGRLSIIFSIINSVLINIVLPNFSRCQSIHLLRRRYFQILGYFIFIGIVLVGFTILFPHEIIWILGKKYSHLYNEVALMVLSTTVSSFVGVMSSLNSAKAWIEYVWVEIPIRIFLQIFLLILLDVSTIKGVLIFSLLSNISPLVVNTMLAYRGLTLSSASATT